MTTKAPNILLVMADQHRADALGCAGNPAVQTPHIDRLAAEGVRFSRVSCQGPLCMPARASFLTERYVRDHGVYTNWVEVPVGTPTYVHALREAGYHTVALGKHHLTKEDMPARHVDDLAHRLHERGFTEVVETCDKFTGAVPNRYTDRLAQRGLLDAYRAHITARSYQGRTGHGDDPTKTIPMWDATPLPLPLDAYIDVWHGDLAVRWLESYDLDQPFFCFVGFPGPHDPWDAPVEARARYNVVEIPLPASTRRPEVKGTGRYGRLLAAFLHLSDTETMTDDAIRAMRAAYYADISVIDEQVGRMLAVLEARGLLDRTWVIYTSDHGEMAGDHGLMSKCVLYQPTVRVPLVVRPPGGRPDGVPAVVDALVEHLDLPATVRAIAGAPDVPASEGRSLLGHFVSAQRATLSVGDRAPWGAPERRSVSISENWGFAAFMTERYALVVDEDACEPCALFDLTDDPAEDVNLLADPGARPVVDELMVSIVRPFLATPPARPHPSPFTG